MLKYSVGLDVSSKDIHCCISEIDINQKVTVRSSRKIANTKKGFMDLVTWMETHRKEKHLPLVICMEATGVYYEHCSMYLHQLGFSVSVILPNHAKKYLQASGQKSKNDKIDAKGLSQMGAEKSLKVWSPLGEYFYQLRALTRHHEDLQQLKTMMGNRMHALAYGMYINGAVSKQLKAHISLLEKQLLANEESIRNHISSHPEVYKKVSGICNIKGLGILSVATILAETNGFLLFENSRQLVSFAGYDAVENQSGKHNGKTRISKKGNSHIRRILFMPAFSVVRHQVAPFADLYERTFAKHGIKMKSYVAVQKKLLVIIYALWKKGEAYDAAHREKHTGEQEAELSLGLAAVAGSKVNSIDIKQVVPATVPALHKVNIPGEQSPYASSRQYKIKKIIENNLVL